MVMDALVFVRKEGGRNGEKEAVDKKAGASDALVV
jgi:hypothetical protein